MTISISLTDFIDFISSSGTQKLSQVAEYKRREQYRYRVDYWRELRNSIIEFHADGTLEKDYFDTVIKTNFINAEKREKCRPLVENYKKFLGRKQITFKPIIKRDWVYSKDLTIRVNPELHLVINGKEQLVKFYFKKDPLSKKQIDIALLLVKIATQDVISGVHYTLVDLPHNKSWTQENPNMKLLPLLKGEAENYITIYKNLP
jgi:hypothetical protein